MNNILHTASFRRISLMLFTLLFVAMGASAQKVAVKTNLIYDAALTPNLGLELGLSKHSTLEADYGLNLWKNSYKHRQWKHWQSQIEYRWWPCSKFNGHFLGIHAQGGEFNMTARESTRGLLHHLAKDVNKRYEGWNVGGGISYGYQWILSRHWNLEASLGVGYQWIRYKKYPCAQCGTLEEKYHANYIGIDKAALSIMYVF